jgi:hypothetical protein
MSAPLTVISTERKPLQGDANPQMPDICSPSPRRQGTDACNEDEKGSTIIRAGMPSWDDLRGNPHFKIGIIINSSSTNDRHIPSIAKPATPCTLISVAVLHSEENEDREVSMDKWFEKHQLQAEASTITVGWGREGLQALLESEVDAVYIIVPPG